MVLEVLARKRSADPSQEALRERKANWNKEVSLLIAQVIAFKRGINGRGEPRVGLPPSSIKEPLPTQVGQYLDMVASKYENIIQEAHAIIDNQNEYSRTRRKGRKETGTVPTQPVPAVAINRYDLVKEASWWGSRLWAYIKHYPRFWNKQLKHRTRALWAAARVSRSLLDIEDFLVSMHENAIPRAIHSLLRVRHIIDKDFTGNIEVMLNMLTEIPLQEPIKPEFKPEQKAEKPESEEELPKPLSGAPVQIPWDPKIDWQKVEYIANQIASFGAVINAFNTLTVIEEASTKSFNKAQKDIDTLTKILGRFRIDNKYLDNQEMADQAKEKYNTLIVVYSKVINECNGLLFPYSKQNFDNFNDMIDFMDKNLSGYIKNSNYNPDIEKLAHNYLTRMLKRWRMGILPSNTEKLRLKSVKEVRNIFNQMGDVQDMLEDANVDAVTLATGTISILKSLEDFETMLVELVIHHNTDYEEQKMVGKKIKVSPVRPEAKRELEKKKFNLIAVRLGQKLMDVEEQIKQPKSEQRSIEETEDAETEEELSKNEG